MKLMERSVHFEIQKCRVNPLFAIVGLIGIFIWHTRDFSY
jgi:hypothetical protein